jgi:hypothetical protein
VSTQSSTQSSTHQHIKHIKHSNTVINTSINQHNKHTGVNTSTDQHINTSNTSIKQHSNTTRQQMRGGKVRLQIQGHARTHKHAEGRHTHTHTHAHTDRQTHSTDKHTGAPQAQIYSQVCRHAHDYDDDWVDVADVRGKNTFPHLFEKKIRFHTESFQSFSRIIFDAYFSSLRILMTRKQLVGVSLWVVAPKNMRACE